MLANTLELMLVRDEGEVLHAYEDSRGFMTLGVGRLIDPKRGGCISRNESRYLLTNDIIRVKAAVASLYPWAAALDNARLAVIHSMYFQLGPLGFSEFKKFIAAAIHHDWPQAVAEMKDSDWYAQTPGRVDLLAKQLLEGAWQ